MPDLAFATSAYARKRGDLPDLPIINMFVEQTPSSERGVVLQSRPGIVANASVGAGPIRGLYQADGVLSGQLVAVSGARAFISTQDRGAITGDGPVSFAASGSELLINAGGPIYRTDGGALAAVMFPDNANVARLVDIGGYFLAIRRDTQQIYFSGVLDGESWQALDYASAENEPDPLRDAVVTSDTLVLFGSQTVEFWAKTGNADLPFSPIEGKVFQKGIIATGAAVRFDNSVAWIGNNKIVYVAGNVPDRISDSGIEEQLDKSTSFDLWSFFWEGHEFLVVRLSHGSWLFDAQTRQWCEFQSYARSNWRARTAPANGLLFGDDTNGTIWTFGNGYVDAGGVLERRFRAGLPLAGPLSVNNVRLVANVGETTALIGDYADPIVELRSSDDGGRTWSEWEFADLGAQGNYRIRPEWRRLGMFDDPSMLFEFRVTDPVPFRVSAAKFNEGGGGRSR